MDHLVSYVFNHVVPFSHQCYILYNCVFFLLFVICALNLSKIVCERMCSFELRFYSFQNAVLLNLEFLVLFICHLIACTAKGVFF